MSNRTYNICEVNQLSSVFDILDYWKTNKTFQNLKNCGAKSQNELITICRKYKNLKRHIFLNYIAAAGVKYKDMDQVIAIRQIFERVKKDPQKWKYAQHDVNCLFMLLSVRTKNCINTLINDVEFNLDKFMEKAIFVNCNFGEIKHSGAKTVQELIRFTAQLKEVFISFDNREFNRVDLLITELERILDVQLEHDEELIKSIKTKQLNLIQFFDKYVLNSKLCSARDKSLLIYLLHRGKYLNQKTVFESIAKKYKLSMEGVRQLSVKLDNTFPSKFNFLTKLFEYSYDLKFNINNQKFWKITSQPLSDFQAEKIENTPNTLGNILSYFGGDRYYSLTKTLKLKGSGRKYGGDNYKRYRSFGVPCIIHHEFLSESTMVEILNTVYSKLFVRINQDFTYNFDEFNLNNEQQKFVVNIVSHNFNLQQSIGGGVLLKKNTIITGAEIIETILREQDDLMSAEEIHAEFNQRFPEREKPINSIRSALQGDSFIYLRGRISLYGLKEWKDERGLKTGSIKDICLEFIGNNNEPVHIFSISKHLQKFRKTSIKNLYANLKIDPLNRFVFFDAYFVGLTTKKYPDSLINNYHKVTAHDANRLNAFIKNHLYYDLGKVISKFSKDFDLQEVQIEYIINSGCEAGILKVKNNRVYYAMSEEDSYMSNLFRNSVKFEVSGFNPYRIKLDETKMMCRLVLHNENKFTAKEQLFDFSDYDINHTCFKSLFIYQKSLKSITAFIWSSQEDISAIIDNQFYLSEEPEVSYEKLNDSLYKLSFSEENINNFVLSFENIIRGSSNEQDIDLSIYDISSMNKLQAIAHIVNMTELKTGVTIDLVEAKKFYNQIQIENTIK